MTNAVLPASHRTKTLTQLILVTGGRVCLLGSWFAATLLLARVIGPIGFGLYVFCQNAIKIVTGCVGDSIDTSVMRKGPLLILSDRPQAMRLVHAAFWMRVGIGALVLIAAIVAPQTASRALFNRPDLRSLAILVAAGVLGDFLLRSVLGFFQISEQFGRFMAVDFVWQFGRVVVVLALFFMHKLTAIYAIGLYVAAPYAAFIVAWILLPPDARRPAPPQRREVIDIARHSSWIAIGMTMAAAYERLDVILLTRFKGDYEVGIYGGALAWAVIPDFLNGILQTVLAPKVAPAFAAGTFNALQRWYLKYAIPAGAAAAGLAMLLGGWAIRTFMSNQYHQSVAVFHLLILSTLFNLVFTPLPEALLNFVSPRRVSAYTAVGLVWVAVGGVIFIPRYGASGAALVMLTARVLVGSMIVVQAHILGRNGGTVQVIPLPAELPGHLEESA